MHACVQIHILLARNSLITGVPKTCNCVLFVLSRRVNRGSIVSVMISGYDPVVQSLLGTLFTWGLTALGAALVFVFSSSQVCLLTLNSAH